jgi:GntR family transcriptional regulator
LRTRKGESKARLGEPDVHRTHQSSTTASHVAAVPRIARSSPIPYYLQLFEILSEAIDRNAWPLGGLIPSEAELAKTYGISRTVIRKALDRLVAAGRVKRLKGKGTVVVDPPRFSHEITAAAMRWAEHLALARLDRVLDSRRVAAGPVGSLLRLEAANEVFQVTCLKTEANRPIAITHLFLREDATPAIKRVAESGGVIELDVGGSQIRRQLESRYGVRTSRSEASIEPAICGEVEARELGIQPHQAVLTLSLVSYDMDGRPISFSRTVFSTERSRMSSS